MTLFDFERLTGFLTIATLVFVVAVVLSARFRALISDQAGVFGLAISAGATLGSLVLSEVLDQLPCELCWYQRIFMYPLPVLIVMSIVRRTDEARFGVVALAALGSAVSVWHLIVQWVPGTGTCDVSNPCSSRILEFLGFISTPAMALTAFVATAISMLVWRPK